MKPIALLIFPALLNAAQVASIDFQIEEGTTTEVTMSANTGDGDRGNVTYSGNYLTELSFNSVTLEPKSFSFTGGRVDFSDTLLTFTSEVFYEAIDTSIVTRFTEESTNTSSTVTTPNSPGSITNGNQLTNEDHIATFDQGTISISTTILNTPSSNTVDLSINPESGPIIGTNSISLTETGRNLYTRTLSATLTNVISSEDELAFEGTNSVLTFTESGTVVAKATFNAPTPYGAWLERNGLEMLPPETLNPHGLAYALLFALDLPVHSAAIPLSVIKTETGLAAHLPLPDDGLPVALSLEGIPSLTPLPNWSQLQTFPVGTTGPIVFDLSEASTSYLRVVAESPTADAP